jgi:probable phosphoglycerate mutase
MKHFFIIRHGETELNKLRLLQGRGINASVNKVGRSQAHAIAKALSIYPIQKIVTSSLIRTQESAAPLAEIKSINIESWKELDEMSFGDLEGKSFNNVLDQLKFLQNEWSFGNTKIPVPGGESPEDVYERAGKKIREIAENSSETHIAVFIHGRLIRILLSEILGLGLKNMQQIQHENGAINHLIWENGVFKTVQLNIVNHLHHLKKTV